MLCPDCSSNNVARPVPVALCAGSADDAQASVSMMMRTFVDQVVVGVGEKPVLIAWSIKAGWTGKQTSASPRQRRKPHRRVASYSLRPSPSQVTLRSQPARDRPLLVGVRRNQAGIDREPSPPTRAAAMHASCPAQPRRKISLSNAHCGAENTEWSGILSSISSRRTSDRPDSPLAAQRPLRADGEHSEMSIRIMAPDQSRAAERSSRAPALTRDRSRTAAISRTMIRRNHVLEGTDRTAGLGG
jgi:hypothetical protein